MALPFELPAITAGFAALTSRAREVGDAAASGAARSLSALLGTDVRIQGRALPGAGAARVASERVAIDLAALPAGAVLEVESSLIAAFVDALAGGPGTTGPAGALTPVEAAALELLALVALDGACQLAAVEEALAPRLARDTDDPASPLAVELAVGAGSIAGRARLRLPAAAVRALGAPAGMAGPGAALAIPVSWRSGWTALSTDELAALGPGDVVLLDPAADPPDALVLPGGARASGRVEDGTFHVAEVTMTDRHAQLPVTLEVELARVDIPLSEIARIEPGATLPLALDRRGLVTLRVGERAVARGELVDVDGAVGVRVTSVEVTP